MGGEGRKKAPQPTAKSGATAGMPPPLQQLGGETGSQQQQAWQSLDQDGDYPTQSKHGQYNKLLSVHSLRMKDMTGICGRGSKSVGQSGPANIGWPNPSITLWSKKIHVDVGMNASVQTMLSSFQFEIPPILSDKKLLSSSVARKNCFSVEKGVTIDVETKLSPKIPSASGGKECVLPCEKGRLKSDDATEKN